MLKYEGFTPGGRGREREREGGREREGESERESEICDGLSEAILLLSWDCLRPPSSSAIHCSARLC